MKNIIKYGIAAALAIYFGKKLFKKTPDTENADVPTDYDGDKIAPQTPPAKDVDVEPVSFDRNPEYTVSVGGLGSVKKKKRTPKAKNIII